MEHYKFMSNLQCEHFPCHNGADPEHFNCLFCYCPLYVLGDRCGGSFAYTENGRKDCSGCLIPHMPDKYDYILSRYEEIAALMERPSDTPARKPAE